MARRGMGSATQKGPKAVSPIRCAIYTRKSTDEGLDKDFNSLDAQREACEDFIRSQKGEGWVALPDRYNDGGFTGANTKRPALQRLLEDMRQDRLDCLVVYKLDRLSRSVRDYLNLLAFLEEHGIAFVSVTQQFNTTTPVGRMTLRMLLSFAEFERDLVSERTRDKMSAARRKGKWTGGPPPLGYDLAPEGGRLIVNRDEAEQVRAIFELYIERRSLVAVAQELNRRGWRRKSWTTRGGRRREGKPWDKASVHQAVSDPVYAGFQKLRGETFRGEHEAIIPKALFEKVQRILAENRQSAAATHRNRTGALLRGVLRCAACDAAMVHHWTRSAGREYRYYTCSRSQKLGRAACSTGSIPAVEIEDFVVGQVAAIGTDPGLQAETFRQAVAQARAERRGLEAEARRLGRDLAALRRETDALVGQLAGVAGATTDALTTAIEARQQRQSAIDRRLGEIRHRLAELDAQRIDESDLRRALRDFAPLWEVLTVPERERVLRLLIERVDYDGRDGTLKLSYRLAGFAQLVAEVATEEAS